MTYADRMIEATRAAMLEVEIAFSDSKYFGPPKPSMEIARKQKDMGADFRVSHAAPYSFAWTEERADLKAQQSAFRRARGLND